jgi:hypothetical protein
LRAQKNNPALSQDSGLFPPAQKDASADSKRAITRKASDGESELSLATTFREEWNNV